jgi:hypothetical protein
MSVKTKKQWTMPDWMKSFEKFFNGHGGNGVEDIMNRDDKNLASYNIIVFAMKCETSGEVAMLERLFKAGLLKLPESK